MVLPPGPIKAPILSTGICNVIIRGAVADNSVRALLMISFILSRINKRPVWACAKASRMMSKVIPVVLMSIWRPVIPSDVPATLKSMSPRWSSIPWMSVSTCHLPSAPVIKPMATPATGRLIGTPASINDKLEPQTEAIDEEPLDDNTSETKRMV